MEGFRESHRKRMGGGRDIGSNFEEAGKKLFFT